MTDGGLVVRATGAVCAVGIGARQTAASVRAGVAGFRESRLRSGRLDPFTLATLPEECLEPLAPALRDDPGLPPRAARLVRLAAPALREAAAAISGSLPIFLGLPTDCRDTTSLLEWLAIQSEVPLDLSRSRVFPCGRAAGLVALEAAIAHGISSAGHPALVGGVDSHLDRERLATLDEARRVLAPDVLDGFIPGEGAAFALVDRPPAGSSTGEALAIVSGVAVGEEPGHLHSGQPCRGDGLSGVLDHVADALGPDAGPVRTVFAGLNGENVWAKEWGVAALRVHRLLADGVRMEHPADCFGDPGAALGPLMLSVAVEGLRRGWLRGPVLVWCASDGTERAAACLRAATDR